MDISSLPMSESQSQNNTLLNFDKYNEDRMPNALSSLNDVSFPEEDPSDMIKTPETVKKIMSTKKDEDQKLQLITKEIYKVAQEMASEANLVNKNQADYISNWALKIMDIINKKKEEKSLDTIMFEFEEQEIQKKFDGLGESILTESDIFENEGYKTPEDDNKFGTIVIRDNVKDKINLKNLKKQFSWNQRMETQRTYNLESQGTKNQENKTTAATSQRKKNLEIRIDQNSKNFKPFLKEDLKVNQFIPKGLPFDYKESSTEQKSMNSQRKIDIPIKNNLKKEIPLQKVKSLHKINKKVNNSQLKFSHFQVNNLQKITYKELGERLSKILWILSLMLSQEF